MSALASDLPERNGWTIAEHAGDRTPDRTQRLLNRASWDDAGGDERRSAGSRRPGWTRPPGAAARGRMAVGALDETGQEKHGQRHGRA